MLEHNVKLNRFGFAIVPIHIRTKNSPKMLDTYYKIDTGANCTTISCKRLFELGYNESWIKSGKLLTGDARPTVASGIPVEDCYEVTISHNAA